MKDNKFNEEESWNRMLQNGVSFMRAAMKLYKEKTGEDLKPINFVNITPEQRKDVDLTTTDLICFGHSMMSTYLSPEGKPITQYIDIMDTQKEEIILPDNPKAAEYRKDLEGWCTGGFYYGKGPEGERRAREAGATHVKCPECSNIRIKDNWGICESCRDKKYQQRFLDMPWKEWDGITPLVIYGDDRFFFDEDDINCYLEDSEDESLQLCICEPVYARALREDYWEDCFPDNNDNDEEVLPADLIQKIKEINEILAGMPPVAWKQGKFRTTYTYTE